MLTEEWEQKGAADSPVYVKRFGKLTAIERIVWSVASADDDNSLDFIVLFLFLVGYGFVLFVTFSMALPRAFLFGIGPWGLSYMWLSGMLPLAFLPVWAAYIYIQTASGRGLLGDGVLTRRSKMTEGLIWGAEPFLEALFLVLLRMPKA